MPKLSAKQANVISYNAHSLVLDLSYDQLSWLKGKAHMTEMEASDCGDLIGSMFEYMRHSGATENEAKKAAAVDIISSIIDKYRNI